MRITLFCSLLSLVATAPTAGAKPADHYASLPANAAASDRCSKLLTVRVAPETSAFIGYIGELWEQRLIGELQLKRLLDSIERNGKLTNPITEDDIVNNSALYNHRDGIADHLIMERKISRQEVREWLLNKLQDSAVAQVHREEAKTETVDPHEKIEIFPVPGGQFRVGDKGEKKKVTLTHTIGAMSTKVTQKMWVEIMGDNPAKFADGAEAIEVTVNGKQIKMQPNNPVEHITWWSAIMFANKLSEKHGLKPAYDVSEVKFEEGTSAADGTLQADSLQAGKMKINAPNGDIYQAEGFRLPTDVEQEYLLRAAGSANGEYYFGDNEAHLNEHAWFAENASGTTLPVALRKPLRIGGNDFYDLHGNVWEWSHDYYYDYYSEYKFRGGKDPQGPKTGSERTMRGGSWVNQGWDLRSALRQRCEPNRRLDCLGCRLVRTLK